MPNHLLALPADRNPAPSPSASTHAPSSSPAPAGALLSLWGRLVFVTLCKSFWPWRGIVSRSVLLTERLVCASSGSCVSWRSVSSCIFYLTGVFCCLRRLILLQYWQKRLSEKAHLNADKQKMTGARCNAHKQMIPTSWKMLRQVSSGA